MLRARLLIVDDDAAYAGKLAGALEGVFRVEICHSEAEFRERFEPGRYELLIVDLRLEKDREGLALLREVQAADPLQAAIVMTAYADMETYTDALAAGAMTYLDKREFSPTLIARTVEAIVAQAGMRRRVNDLEQRIETAEPLEIIGASPSIRRVRDELRRAAEANAPVLLTGGPGSGKELAARNIHRLNRRRSDGPFVRAACGRGQRDELTLRLFGGVQGLDKRRTPVSKGWIEEARGGVLLIDGTDGVDEAVWSALVSSMKSGVCKHPVDGRRIEADVQVVVAATTGFPPVFQSWAAKAGVNPIALPALCEHAEDVALLAQYTLQGLYREGRTQVRSLRGAAVAVLESQPWPGNVRELQSAIAYAAIRADAAGEREIGPEHLPLSATDLTGTAGGTPQAFDYQQNLARAELALVESAIETFGVSTKTELARRLGYNDRFIFARRIRKCLLMGMGLRSEFPKTGDMMSD